jgi:hypothetical protein
MSPADNSLADEAFIRLLTEVGRKLVLMEAKEQISFDFDEVMPDIETSTKTSKIESPTKLSKIEPVATMSTSETPTTTSNVEIRTKMTRMGPIEKVEKWRENQQLSIEEVKKAAVGVVSNLPSCYGSCPTR